MKRVLAGTVVMSLAIVLGSVAQAQEKLRVGVLDVRKVLVESTSGQRHRDELEKMIKERRDKLTAEDANIKSLQEKLKKDELVLTDKQKEQKQKEIGDKIEALKKASQEAQAEVAKRDNELSEKASAIVRDIIDDVAKQEKLSMVIDKHQSGIFWVEDKVDITDKVMKAFEAKTKK